MDQSLLSFINISFLIVICLSFDPTLTLVTTNLSKTNGTDDLQNPRPTNAMNSSVTYDETKPSAISSNSSSLANIHYYSPKTYGKRYHKNHQMGSFAYLYPKRRTTSTSTTTTTSAPNPDEVVNKYFGRNPDNGSPDVYGKPPNDTPKIEVHMRSPSNDKHTPEIKPTFDDEPNYYFSTEKTNQLYYTTTTTTVKPMQSSTMPSTETPPTMSSYMPAYTEKSDTSVVSYKKDEEPNAEHMNEEHKEGKEAYPLKSYGKDYGAKYPEYPRYYPPADGSDTTSVGNSNGDGRMDGSVGMDGFGGMGGFGGMDGIGGMDGSGATGGGGEGAGNGGNPVRTGTWLGPGIAGLIIGILPLATLIASIIPAFVSIPVVSAIRRRRSIQDFGSLNFNNTNVFLNPGGLDIIGRYGMNSLDDSSCLMEMLCTFAAEGKTGKNSVQNLFYYLIDWTPDRWAEWLSVAQLFGAVKQNKCENTYRCMAHKVKLKDTEFYT